MTSGTDDLINLVKVCSERNNFLKKEDTVSENIIEAKSLSKKYKGLSFNNKNHGIGLWISNILKLTANKAQSVDALKETSFNVKKGEILGIYGANGAGKTTLIKILSGLLSADTGSLTINGSSNIREIKNSISYVSTNGWMGLEWQLTAKENLELYGNIFGMSSKDIEKRIEEVLRLMDMEEHGRKYISQLSAGMRQKITIARGFVIDRPILYLDEPSVSLDVNAARNTRKFIKEYVKKQSKTAIITSHVYEDLEICDILMFLHKGRMIAKGTEEELYSPYKYKKVIVLKCLSIIDEHIDEIRSLNGILGIRVSTNGSEREYTILRISVDHSQQLVDEILDMLLSMDVLVLNMDIRKISLQEIYEEYVIEEEARIEAEYGTN